MVIKAPTESEYIYKAEFEYDEGPIKSELKFEKSTNSKAIQEKLEGNIMGFGKPECWNLKELCEINNAKLPVEMESLLDKYAFWLVQSKVSFMPSPNSQLLWLRIASKVESLSGNMEDPVVYDAYPKEIREEKIEMHKKTIGLDFKFSELLDAKGEYIEEIECSKLEPVITIAGLGESETFWDFRGGASTSFGGLHALYSIIELPPESKGMKISYFSRAQVKTKWGLFPVSLKKKLNGEKGYTINF